MTVHQCPKCELKFAWKTEVDDHCRRDHPEFHHDYPAAHRESPPAEPLLRPRPAGEADPHRARLGASQLVAWALPKHAHDEPTHRHGAG